MTSPGTQIPATPTRFQLPLLRWLGGYRGVDLAGDTNAGLVVAGMVVPQAMAYAILAGLPPQVGLYAGIAPKVARALLSGAIQFSTYEATKEWAIGFIGRTFPRL